MIRYLAVVVLLLHSFASAGMLLSSRRLAMGIHVIIFTYVSEDYITLSSFLFSKYLRNVAKNIFTLLDVTSQSTLIVAVVNMGT
jgi:hypothetical protein